jgi:hypothetical protein
MSTRELYARLRTGLHAYRQLGPRRGSAAVARRSAQAARSRLRRAQLERKPVRVSEAEVRAALGGRDVAEVLRAAQDAMPCVRRWRAELETISPELRQDLLRRAEDLLAHRFDLLGSGPADLGAEIDWARDFKTGRAWPQHHISKIRVSYPDSSDIKVPWELSRCQHLPLLAAANVVTGDERYLDEIGAQLQGWIVRNPVEFGVNWACTMDVAIRAVNWVATLALCDDRAIRVRWLDEVLASLLLHARFIRSHLEYSDARGNHYLADVVGLLVTASLFSGSQEGRAWADWATRELARELRHQVRADGCQHEASTSYHRLVTELFIVGADAADALMPAALDPGVRAAIDRMLGFVADYARPDALAPQIGDADDGRLLPLGDYGSSDQRSHLHLFRQADRPYARSTVSAAYREGGFYFMRAGDLYAAIRCGDVGIYGRGCHAHNDLLAFELCCGATPLVLDPGSYLYTADPAARNRFRSTAVHSTLQIDGAEQNEIRDDRLFAMVDRARAEVLTWEVGRAGTVFRGRHHGFESLAAPATHTRTLRLYAGALEITDEVDSDAGHDLTWAFPLAPADVAATADGAVARFAGVTLTIIANGISAEIEQGWISPSYGQRFSAPLVRLRARSEPGTYRATIQLAIDRG